MAAPTFIQEAETAWNTNTTPKTTASFSVQTGDVLVAFAARADNGSPSITLTHTGGAGMPFTPRQTINVSSYATIELWTSVVDSNKSMTVTFTNGAAALLFGGNVLTFRGSDGVGASSKTNVTNGAPTLNLTTTQANSAIVVINADWTAKTAARTWRTVNGITPTSGNGLEVSYFADGSNYAAHGAYYSDAGAIGTYAVGQTAPTGQTYSIAAVEVKGAASGGSSTPLSLSASLTPAGLLTRRANKPFAGII